MPPRVKSEHERQQLREQIIDAARELFVSKGVEAVTMREIAKGVGYSATSIYLYFTDKDALLRAICDADLLKLAHALKQVFTIVDPAERLLALGKSYANFALSHPNHYRILFMAPRPSCVIELSSLQHNTVEQDAYFQLKMVVNEVYLASKFKPEIQDTELVAQTIWAAIHGVCSLEISMANDVWINWRPIEARLQAMYELIIKGMLKESYV
ncbi:MAG: TetR/AcrR family transcriptional regulator [Methylophilus sp.]|jgi:AcrR family transcriptional regulator